MGFVQSQSEALHQVWRAQATERLLSGKTGRDGYRSDCKSCFATRAKQWYSQNREHVIGRVHAWQRANPERVKAIREAARPRRAPIDRDARLRRVFGLSAEDYEVMLAHQEGRCALCKRLPSKGRSLHVDHNHKTGVVRGLLCFRCNAGMGQFREDIFRFADAIVYLARGGDALEMDAAERELMVGLVYELVGNGNDPSVASRGAPRAIGLDDPPA
ncbi:MAG TPA: endonuclease VII domain-containing protein [Acidimicrobiia bacterium]|nr:endonuclease VII domain-containing protein [Acidimicrobiia bacterium]